MESTESESENYENSENSENFNISEEEGQVNDEPSDNSLDFDDGYDSNLMGNAADVEMLNSMTEVEREKELFKRMERREALKARRMIEKRLKASKRDISEVKSDQFRPKRSNLNPSSSKKTDSINRLKEQRLKHKLRDDDETDFIINTSNT